MDPGLQTNTRGNELSTPQSTRGSRGNRRARSSNTATRGGKRQRPQNTTVPETIEARHGESRNERTEQVATSTSSRTSIRGRARTAGGRRFGGELTQTSILQPDAPVFEPSQPSAARQHVTKQRPRRASKSVAPDLPTRIHEDIDNLQYECAICTNNIQRNSLAWSCKSCWTVLHFNCTKKWAASSIAERQQQQRERPNAESENINQWRCPGCNLPQDELPKVATCWCAKEIGHKSTPGLPPFSCGQTCSRSHVAPKNCPHPCQEICHAGPCPPCPHNGPTQSCFCGRETATRRCVDTNYEEGWSCGQMCDDMLPCGQHNCTRPCHEGLCGSCDEPITVQCYCGAMQRQIPCNDKGQEINSSIGTTSWTGSFDCKSTCDRDFDCGKHKCKQQCHPQDTATPHCPRSPDMISHCPCGKTRLLDLISTPRQSCEDGIPNCTKVCEKSLPCRHPCQEICHLGDCLPCMQNTTITCRCGRTTSSTICHQGSEEQPQCIRICRATLNCGRHQCDERCCSGERKAGERQATKRKLQKLNPGMARALNEAVEAEHVCTLTCGRILKCGNHPCQELCHRGPCGSCREAIFDDISCHCGRTVLQSPLPCGTRPPPCRYECERPKDCGHPQVAHNCHMDDELCPKCPFLTTKTCMCGKHQLRNQPCWLTEVRCGDICGQKLKTCGVHACRKPCHKPGECEDASLHCQQECGREKSCGHPDSATCHAPSSCKEDKQCLHKIMITCICQRIKKETSCNSTKHTRGNLDKTLDCDEECARLERNHRLAVALNIDSEAHKDDHIPYSAETLNMFVSNSVWAQSQEKGFRSLAADPEQKRLRFKPMPASQRAFLHSLAEDFGFDSESMDPEPHRHVAIFKTPRFVMAPMKTLAECARIRPRQGLVVAAAAMTVDTSKKPKASNVVGEPYNSFLLTRVRFGLTLDELRLAIRPALSLPQAAAITVHIEFLPNEDVVMVAKESVSGTPMPRTDLELEIKLVALKPAIARQMNSQGYGDVQLCRIDSSLNVQRRELDSAASGGWSQVAAKAAAPRRAPGVEPVGKKSSFTVLESGLAKKKKQRAEPQRRVEDVAEDWEAAENMEEEKERQLQSGDVSAETSGDDILHESDHVAEGLAGVRIADSS